MTSLRSADYVSHLDRELTAYAAALGAAVTSPVLLDRPIPACPGWNARDLTHHLISVHAWVAQALLGGGDNKPEMPEDKALLRGFSASATFLREVLDAPGDTACWTFTEARTVIFWQRRQSHENAIHRWDLESALGHDGQLDPDLAADGIDEVVTMFWPRQIQLGRAKEPDEQVRLRSLTGCEWVIGRLGPADDPCATVSGSTEDLCLALWGRIGWDDRSLTWSGDRTTAAAVLSRSLVP